MLLRNAMYTYNLDTGCNLVQPFSEQERIGKDNTYGSNSNSWIKMN